MGMRQAMAGPRPHDEPDPVPGLGRLRGWCGCTRTCLQDGGKCSARTLASASFALCSRARASSYVWPPLPVQDVQVLLRHSWSCFR